MAIIMKAGRPAIDIIQDSYTPPPGIWESRLGNVSTRNLLQATTSAVGRLDYVGFPTAEFGGTAFVVGPDLLMSCGMVTDVVTIREGDIYLFQPGMSAMVDFKRELIPSESVFVKIDEVLYVDSRCRIALLRAKLPSNIKPLRLSVRDPEDLGNRYVAVIGHPAKDVFNDPGELQHKIMGGSYNVKRLLPGQLMGHEQYDVREFLGGKFLAMTHDCSTGPGCSGAPLIDLETGEVVGVHFAGVHKLANYAVSSWELARDPRFAEYGVQFAGPLPELVSPEPVAVKSSETDGNLSEARVSSDSSIDPLVDDATDVDTDQAYALEAIVLADARPAFLVKSGRTKFDGSWEPILKPHDPRLALAIRSVGKICVAGGSVPWVGTAFVVGSCLAMASSHSVRQFATGSCGNVTLKSGIQPTIDFSEALGLPSGEATARVVNVRFIHPFFQVALLELDQVPAGVGMLDLAAQMPSKLAGRTVAVLSYIDQDYQSPQDWQEAVFGKQWGRLFVLPGRAVQLGQTPGATTVPALMHDCCTLAGSGGAPVVDLDTGYVIGVHTHNEWLEAGYAQPTWELARDPNVWSHPIRFRPDPRPSWLTSWEDPHPVPTQPVTSSKPKGERWTVDQIPIDFQREEPRKLERLLFQTIRANEALYLAENVGLQLGLVNSSLPEKLLWREVLKKASIAGQLRRLIQTIADAPEHAGIAPQIREVL